MTSIFWWCLSSETIYRETNLRIWLCFVISGTWWVNSGENFEPEATVPVPTGGFVRRVAHTPHYDGVKKGGKEPAVIGIFGQAPIEFKLTDPTKPPVREV